MLKIGVMVSGGGTNLQAIIDAIETGKITNTEIRVVLSNNQNAYALERARKAGIEAGFLVTIPAAMIEKYRSRIINIHPSLIPSFCGVGYYGLKVHEAALKRGVKVTGATVHYVDEGVDSGPIILQKAVEVKEGDTPEILQRRVMEEAEWIILPQAINMIANQ